MTQTFTANGKLLLTGEYLVLHGALALALPLRLGQSLTVTTHHSESLQWNAYTPDGLWFSANLNPHTLEILNTDDPAKAETLKKILSATRELNPNAFNHSLRFDTHLDFNPSWGLGSSSTLISNIARWAQVNPYQLLKMTFGGSGYDIACATNATPIFYRLEMNQPVTAPAFFKPPFAHQLFFVYLGHKQQSSNEVKNFNQRTQHTDLHEARETVTEISRKLPTVKYLDDFCEYLQQHEAILARCLNREPVQKRFPDFEGTMKSLGAWGGDFILAATPWTEHKVREYFHAKDMDVIFNYNTIVYP